MRDPLTMIKGYESENTNAMDEREVGLLDGDTLVHGARSLGNGNADGESRRRTGLDPHDPLMIMTMSAKGAERLIVAGHANARTRGRERRRDIDMDVRGISGVLQMRERRGDEMCCGTVGQNHQHESIVCVVCALSLCYGLQIRL